MFKNYFFVINLLSFKYQVCFNIQTIQLCQIYTNHKDHIKIHAKYKFKNLKLI